MSREERVELLEREPNVTSVAGVEGEGLQGLPALSVRIQTQLLGLNRSSLYYQPKPPSQEELLIKRRIDEIYTARPFYGYRRITIPVSYTHLRAHETRH